MVKFPDGLGVPYQSEYLLVNRLYSPIQYGLPADKVFVTTYILEINFVAYIFVVWLFFFWCLCFQIPDVKPLPVYRL